MFGLSKFWWIVAMVIAVMIIYAKRPYATALPYTDEQLTTLEQDLARLSVEDAQLVRDFLKRVGGKVDSPAILNLDAVTNAHTFGEAIAEQKTYLHEQKVINERRQAKREVLEQTLAPMKAYLQLQWSGFEYLTSSQLPKGSYFNDGSTQEVMAFIIKNQRDKTIENLKLHAAVYSDHDGERPVVHCDLSLDQPIEPFESRKVYCIGHSGLSMGKKDDPLTLLWEPQEIELRGGQKLSLS